MKLVEQFGIIKISIYVIANDRKILIDIYFGSDEYCLKMICSNYNLSFKQKQLLTKNKELLIKDININFVCEETSVSIKIKINKLSVQLIKIYMHNNMLIVKFKDGSIQFRTSATLQDWFNQSMMLTLPEDVILKIDSLLMLKKFSK